MLNIEKYKDELEQLGVLELNLNMLAVVDGKPAACCLDVECDKCEFCDKDGECEDGYDVFNRKSLEWLFSEYKEPEIDWSKVKVDTPILVKDSANAGWKIRYFAKYDKGTVYTWSYGRTSLTADGSAVSWKYAQLAESEE